MYTTNLFIARYMRLECVNHRLTTHYTRIVCKKVKFSLCLTKFYAMQTYRVVKA
jgi:hypothetical protein